MHSADKRRHRTAAAVLAAAFLACLVSSFHAFGVASDTPEADARARRSGYPLAHRLDAFELQRRYPFTKISSGRLRAARLQFESHWRFGAVPARGLSVAASGAPWTPLGPFNINGTTAGRVTGLALDPATPGILYAATASGGVWKTADTGASWTPRTDTECSLAMGSIAVDPANPAIVYAGTGEANINHSYYGCGMLRSTDFGATWRRVGASIWDTADGGGASIGRILVDRATAGTTDRTTVFAASSAGLFRSTDSGRTWTLRLAGRVADIAIAARDANAPILYATVSSTGIFRSKDKGDTWTQLSVGLPADNFGRIGIAVAPSNADRLYAAFAFPSRSLTFHSSAGGGFRGVWTSTDAGVTWTQATARGASGARCMYNMVLEVDPRNPSTVYFGAQNLFRSTDAAATFTSIGGGIHVDQHALVIDARTTPPSFYAGNDGGVWTSTNEGANWRSLNNGLVNVQFSSRLAVHPVDPARLLGGLQDNGTIESSAAPSWRRVAGSDGGWSAVDLVTGVPAYRTEQFGPPQRRDAGGGFVTRAAGINTGDRAFFYPPLVMDLRDPAILYFGSARVWRTTNRAQNWAVRSDDLTKGAGFVTAIAAAASDARVAYAGTSDGNVWVTTDIDVPPPALPLWALVTNGVPDRFVTDLAVDPLAASTAYVSVSGFGSGHVFRTTDHGATWTDISANLPDVPVNTLALDAGAVYIGTDLGVLALPPGATAWEAMTNGMPNVAVFGLTVDGPRRRLIAATWGRGAFALALP